jgi:hypothetical protein
MSVADLRANVDANRLPWALGSLLLALVAAILLLTGPRSSADPGDQRRCRDRSHGGR